MKSQECHNDEHVLMFVYNQSDRDESSLKIRFICLVRNSGRKEKCKILKKKERG